MNQSSFWQSMAPRAYEEKRDYPRMQINHDLSFVPVGIGATGVCSGRCQNLSARGVLFTTPTNLQVGELLDINITPPQAVVEPLNAVVEVIRVENDLAQHAYRIAARITQMK